MRQAYPIDPTTHATLDGNHNVIPATDLFEWGQWFESATRRVAEDFVGKVRISTVFLGLNHRYGEGRPLWFETMVFEGPLDGDMDRYTTWDEAEAGHKLMVERVRNETNI
jgi:hypothetical protein